MAILPGAVITFGQVVNEAFETLKTSIDNLDVYKGNITDPSFTGRTVTVSGQLQAAAAKLDINFSGRPPIVTTAAFTAAWNTFINENGFASKMDNLITLKGLIHFLTCLATYTSVRFVVVTNPTNGLTSRCFVNNPLPAITEPSELEPIKASDITGMLASLKDGIDAYKAAPCSVSWGAMAVTCSSCSSSSSSSSCSSSSSSSCSSSSSSSCSYIAWYNLVA